MQAGVCANDAVGNSSPGVGTARELDFAVLKVEAKGVTSTPSSPPARSAAERAGEDVNQAIWRIEEPSTPDLDFMR